MNDTLKIVHVFRDPVGGIFRHVRDLVGEQSEAGHLVGIVCDSNTGGEYEGRLFQKILPQLKLGLHRIPMARSISPRDVTATVKTNYIIKKMRPDVVHCHSAKGGVYGRIAARLNNSQAQPVKAFYCPHGGAMHYKKNSLKGRVFFLAERMLERFTDSLIFVSRYEQSAYHEKVGDPTCPQSVVYNGLSEEEFVPVETDSDCADFLYIGMKRDLKGPDVFLDALYEINRVADQPVSAHFVGDGPDSAKYNLQIQRLQLENAVKTHTAMPAREAFKLAKVVVVPSRAESMPYLVLEAMAAQKPLVCTAVGGIPEIFSDYSEELLKPDDPLALAQAMMQKLHDPARGKQAVSMAKQLHKTFSLQAMSASMEAVYRQ